ncbi:MAG: flagellar export protein FliJ [Bacillota bacterium]
MKKFKFRLEPLLNLKKQEEKNIQKELLRLRKNYNDLKEKLKEFKEDKQNWQQELEEKQISGIQTKELLKYRNYINYLNDQIEECNLELDYWREKIEECQDELLDKVKERKKLSKLKEREYKEHWKEYLQEERKQSDEIATNNYNHKTDKKQGTIF